jgi:hypothetical protein
MVKENSNLVHNIFQTEMGLRTAVKHFCDSKNRVYVYHIHKPTLRKWYSDRILMFLNPGWWSSIVSNSVNFASTCLCLQMTLCELLWSGFEEIYHGIILGWLDSFRCWYITFAFLFCSVREFLAFSLHVCLDLMVTMCFYLLCNLKYKLWWCFWDIKKPC